MGVRIILKLNKDGKVVERIGGKAGRREIWFNGGDQW